MVLIIAVYRGMRWGKLEAALVETAKLTVMIFSLIWGVLIFGRFLGFSGLPEAFATWILSFDTDPYLILGGILMGYVVLGMFMDPLAMQVMTLPFVYPMVTSLGYDGVWFGVIMVKLVELAVLSPPVGMNLFAVIGASEGKVSLSDIYRGIFPFIVIEAIVLILLIAFPQLSLWLPQQMFAN